MLNSGVPANRTARTTAPAVWIALSHDQGLTLEPQYYDRALTEPVCNGSIINYAPRAN